MRPAIYRDDSQVQPVRTPAAGCALLCAFACLLLGCSTGRANSRVEYWVEQTRDHLPVGTRLVDAERFFAARGLKLKCCMSGPDIDNAYSAMERNAGRFVFTEYSVLIVVDVSPDGLVNRVRVQRIGVGL